MTLVECIFLTIYDYTLGYLCVTLMSTIIHYKDYEEY